MRLLFATLVLATGVFTLECPTDACFGQPQGCNPGINCKIVFKFDEDGNLDLYLRDFVDLKAYAAIPLGEETNETYGYLICLPYSYKRLRATAKLGEPITVSEYEMSRTVRKLGDNYFACSFPASELPKTFQRERYFFVTTGQFVDNLVIYDGEQLYSFDSGEDSDEDLDYEPMSGENVKKRAEITDKQIEKMDSPRQQEGVESNDESDESDEEYSEEEIETKPRVSRRSINSVFHRRSMNFRGGRDEDIEQNEINSRKLKHEQQNGNETEEARQSQDQGFDENDKNAAVFNFHIFLCCSIAFVAFNFMF